MDKEALKNLLKENLKVETYTYWDDDTEFWRIVTRILFDDEMISQDYIEMDSI